MTDMTAFGQQIFGAVAQSMSDRMNPMTSGLGSMVNTTVVIQQAEGIGTIDEQIVGVEKRSQDGQGNQKRPLTDRELRTIAQLEMLQAKLTA